MKRIACVAIALLVGVTVAAAQGTKPGGAGRATGAKATTATGVVTSVSSSSLTIKATGGETTFVIDSKTNVIGRGAGTKAKTMKSEGQKTQITDFVHTGDTVRVRAKEEGGSKHASEVRVTVQAKSK